LPLAESSAKCTDVLLDSQEAFKFPYSFSIGFGKESSKLSVGNVPAMAKVCMTSVIFIHNQNRSRLFPGLLAQMHKKDETKYSYQLLNKNNRTGNSHYSIS
jgi:hypothetical protein